jgi:pimeloyl-ACP methyl ester carboxylesterase
VQLHSGDLVGLLEELNIKQTHLLGFSFSGLVVQRVALDHPSLVRSLILVGTSAGLPPEMGDPYKKRAKLIESEGMQAYIGKQLGIAFTPHFMPYNLDEVAWYLQEYLDNDSVTYAAAMRAWQGVCFQKEVGSLRCPVLIIAGAEDKGFITSGVKHLGGAIELHRLIQGSEMEIVPEASHYVQVEKPDAFVTAMLRFLDSIERA